MKQYRRILALLLILVLTLTPVVTAIEPAILEEIRSILRTGYVDPIPEEILARPTVEEILSGLNDPYTHYMTKEEFNATTEETNYGTTNVGVGVEISIFETGLYITRVMPDAPAKSAGILPGDLIVGVDGISLEKAGTAKDLAMLVSGEEGSKVSLTYLRNDVPYTVEMRRASVGFPAFAGEVKDRTAWMSCSTFGESTGRDLGQFFLKEDKNADRWVLDLRGNGGGYATSAADMSNYLAGNREACFFVDRQGKTLPLQSDIKMNPFNRHITEPTILLIDGNSASASEVIAGMVRDYDVGLIIGTTTFGKGVGQSVQRLSDGSYLSYTMERFYSPRGITPDHTGVIPDLMLDSVTADRVAQLLCGEAVQNPSSEVLLIHLAGVQWYVHKDAATGEGRDAFLSLLSALPPNTELTLDNKVVSTAEAAAAWVVEWNPNTFQDTADSPYQEAIHHMAILNMVSGTAEHIFEPNSPLTRAQLCALIVNAMNYWSFSGEESIPFTDVAEDAWYYNPVFIMHDRGIVQGVTETEFRPEATITNQEFMTILARMRSRITMDRSLHVERISVSQDPLVSHFATWAKPAASLFLKLNASARPFASIDPTATVLRGEAAAEVYAMLIDIRAIRGGH